MLKRLKSMPRETQLQMAVFVFTAAFSAFHLVKGVVLMNVDIIVGGLIITAVSIALVLSCWHSGSSDDEGAAKPSDRDKLR